MRTRAVRRSLLRVCLLVVVTSLLGLTPVAAQEQPATRSATPVMGDSRLTEDELYRWFQQASGNFRDYQVSVSPRRLVELFAREGESEGVAWDVAFVQSIIETGWFRYGGQVPPEANNFAGIGAFDSGQHRPFHFATAGMGARAQMQHLRLYADPTTNLQGSNLGSPLARDVDDPPRYPPRWRTVRAIETPHGGYRYAGQVRHWEDFGSGMWATDRWYPCKVLRIYGQALAFNGKSTAGLPIHSTCSAASPTGDAGALRSWLYRDVNAGGNADRTGYLGRAGEHVLVCDIDGNGRETAATFYRGRWWFSPNHNTGLTASAPPTVVWYGRAGDVPLCGDWNGDGRDTMGIVRDGAWHLRNSLTEGNPNISFTYGRVSRGDVPIVGNWDGRPGDGIGIIRDGEWHLRWTLSSGVSDHRFTYGRLTRGDLPLVGDWNRDGRDTPGIVRSQDGGQWHLRNSLAGGNADLQFRYGRVDGGDIPLVGDWNRDGRSTPVIVR